MGKTKSQPVKTEDELRGDFANAMLTLRERVDAGMTILRQSPKELYVQDRRFQVVKWGARFEGIVAHGEKYWSGWSRPLEVGEVIVCDGWKPGLDTDAEGVNWTAPRVPETVLWCQVWPVQGLFTPWPLDGYLRPLPESEQV